MYRRLTFAMVIAALSTMVGLAQAEEPTRDESPFRTAEYLEEDAQIVQVRNRGRRYRGNYYGNRGYYNNYYYSPYRYGYRNYNYGYRYPRYYGNPYYRNYNYGARGSVRVGPFGVWW